MFDVAHSSVCLERAIAVNGNVAKKDVRVRSAADGGVDPRRDGLLREP